MYEILKERDGERRKREREEVRAELSIKASVPCLQANMFALQIRQ